jgi:hypothetical protein
MAHSQIWPLVKPKLLIRSIPNLAGVITLTILAFSTNLIKIGWEMTPPRGRENVRLCDFYLILLLLLFSPSSSLTTFRNQFSPGMAQTTWFGARKCLLGMRTMKNYF